MSTCNAIMNGLFNAILLPFGGMAPWVGLAVFSAVAGVVLLIVFKYTSPQKTIKRIKDRIKAHLYEVRLFKDDMGVVGRATANLLLGNLGYIGCCTIPLIPLVVLVLPMLFQLDSRYGFSPLRPGEKTILDVVLDDGIDPLAADMTIKTSEGVVLEEGPVRVPERHELSYRLRLDREGTGEIALTVQGRTYSKRIDGTPQASAVSPARFRSTEWMDVMMFPVEKPWPADSAVKSMRLRYRRADMLGIDGDLYPWLWIFCIVGLVVGFAFKGVLKVNF